MLDYLVRHALENVWCSPYQDRQAILSLSRISRIGGVRNHFEYQWQRFGLPTQREDYHVYAIGQNSPARLNLQQQTGQWIPLRDLVNSNSLVGDVYTAQGLMLARSLVWVQLTDDLNYLVAIKFQTNTVDLDATPVYLRLYSNAYYNSTRSNASATNVVTNGALVRVSTDALNIQREYHDHRALGVGFAYAFVNGRYVNDWLPSQIKVGDTVAFVYDRSIFQVLDLKLDDLQQYTSELDGLRKYLLHPPKGRQVIDYRDDIDIWLIHKHPTNGRVNGVYYHRNNEKAVRMITHRDYGIPTSFVQDYIQANPGWQDTRNLYIRIHFRHSGYERPLVDEHNRIKELYKLSDAEIVRAMIGLDSTVPEWTVNSLEQSNYARIMRSYHSEISSAMVVDAYGYNAMAKLVADGPIRLTDGRAKLPVGLWYDSTIYEYDSQGILVHWRNHNGGEYYYPVNQSTTMVEGIVGIGGLEADVVLGTAPVQLNSNESYRFYVSPVDGNGISRQEWVDVTDDSTKYTVSPSGLATWLIDSTSHIGIVKGNSHFLSYDLELPEYDNVYRFSVNYTQIQGNVLYIPPGKLDIWMNGKALIENHDYYVVWPQIVIVNKAFLRSGSQSLTIRATGFCEPDLSRILSTQVGYVKHGTVSVNSVYDLRDDKVIRCIAGGRTFHRSDLDFAEDKRHIGLPGLREGDPYVIEDVHPPIRGITAYDTYVLLKRSQQTDKRVSDYLSTKLPEPTVEAPVIIPELFHLYSPTAAKLLFDIQNGFLVPSSPDAPESEVASKMQPYLWMLEYDPCVKDVDLEFVNIHPHPKYFMESVSLQGFLFLQRIVRLYLKGRVDLSRFLEVAE